MKSITTRIAVAGSIAAVAIAMTGAFTGVPASAELIGHWPLDETGGETAADAAGGNDGAWQNAGPTNLDWTTGQIGGAADVTDADDNGNYFTIASIPQLVGTNGWTISAWINPDTQSGGYNGIFMSRTANGAGSWGLALEGGGPYHTDNRMNEGGGLDSPDSINADGSWVHVANTWHAPTGMRRAYLNGALVASSPADGANGHVGSLTESGSWFIGYDDCCGNRDFGGSIDDVALFNNSLDAASVSNIYQAGLAGMNAATANTIPEPTSLTLAGLVAGASLLSIRQRFRRLA